MDVGCEAAHVPLLGFGGKWGMLLTRALLNEVAWRWGGHSVPASLRIPIYCLMEKALIGGPPLYHWFFSKAASGGAWSEICYTFCYSKEPNGHRFLTTLVFATGQTN